MNDAAEGAANKSERGGVKEGQKDRQTHTQKGRGTGANRGSSHTHNGHRKKAPKKSNGRTKGGADKW